VYGIAWAMVAHTDSRFDPELLTLFVQAYQSVEPSKSVTLGDTEYAAVLLVENLRRMAVRIMRSQNGVSWRTNSSIGSNKSISGFATT